MNGDTFFHDTTWRAGSSALARRSAGPAGDRVRSGRSSGLADERPRGRNLRVVRPDPDEGEFASDAEGSSRRFRDRRLVQWFIAYLAVAWLALQLMQTLAEIWSLPVPLQRGISLALALGALPALVVAWYHGELGRQRVCACEVVLLAALTLASTLTIWVLCFA